MVFNIDHEQYVDNLLKYIKETLVYDKEDVLFKNLGVLSIDNKYYETIKNAAEIKNLDKLKDAEIKVNRSDNTYFNTLSFEEGSFTKHTYDDIDKSELSEQAEKFSYAILKDRTFVRDFCTVKNLADLERNLKVMKEYCKFKKDLLQAGVCTPIQDYVRAAYRADVNKMGAVSKDAYINSDVPDRVMSEVAQKELAIKTIAETRGTAGGLVTKNALKDFFHFMPKSAEHPDVSLSGVDLLLSLGGGPISVAVQLVISEAIAWATHSVDAPIYNIRVTGMKWEPVTDDDVKRWNGGHKDNSILANSNVVTLTDSSFNNMVRVSYKVDPKEPRDNQLNYTLTLDPITTPFVRAVQDQPDPWLGNVTSHMGESNVNFAKLRSSGSQEGSAVMKLSLNEDSDKYQDNDVYKFIFQQLGMDAYIPQYLPKPEVGNTTVTSFGGHQLDLNNLHGTPSISHTGLTLTKISDDDKALFISPGTVVKLGLTIPKSSNPNDPSAATRLMASYDAVNPQTGAIISYGQIGSQSMFNALTESKDSLPLLMTAFDCSFPYEAGKTCNATFAMSSQNIKTKGDGKLYIQDANGDYNAIPIHMGYSVYPQPWEFDGEAGSSHKMTLTLSDVSSNNIKKITLKGNGDVLRPMAISWSRCPKELRDKISFIYGNDKQVLSNSKRVDIKSMLNNGKGSPQIRNINTVTPTQCALEFNLSKISEEGAYPITITTLLNDGTEDVQVIPVEVKEPL